MNDCFRKWSRSSGRRPTRRAQLEYPDPRERKRELARVIGVEGRLFVEGDGHSRVDAVVDEDLDCENAEKAAAVHFVRYEVHADGRRRGARGRCSQAGLRPPQLPVACQPVA